MHAIKISHPSAHIFFHFLIILSTTQYHILAPIFSSLIQVSFIVVGNLQKIFDLNSSFKSVAKDFSHSTIFALKYLIFFNLPFYLFCFFNLTFLSAESGLMDWTHNFQENSKSKFLTNAYCIYLNLIWYNPGLLQLEIIGVPVGLGLALANYLHTQSLYLAL